MTLARNILTFSLLSIAAALGSGSAWAEKADRQKPMNIEADSLRVDDAKQTSQFTGNVIVTQGTLVMRASRMDVSQDAQGEQSGTAYGTAAKRAFFRQKRDNVDEYIEGEANRIEYDSKAGEMRLIGNGELRRYIGSKLSDTTDGQRIVYNTNTEVFTVNGSTSAGQSGGKRVRATISPRNKDGGDAQQAPSTATPSSSATETVAPSSSKATAAEPAPRLRGSTTLEEPRP